MSFCICSTTLNAVELARTAIKSGARMSISIARETLQTTQVWKGEVHIHVQFSPSTLCLRCGVPYSCCREDTDEINTNLVNLMCGFGVQYPPGASRHAPQSPIILDNKLQDLARGSRGRGSVEDQHTRLHPQDSNPH